jgi:hypothetical protein
LAGPDEEVRCDPQDHDRNEGRRSRKDCRTDYFGKCRQQNPDCQKYGSKGPQQTSAKVGPLPLNFISAKLYAGGETSIWRYRPRQIAPAKEIQPGNAPR